MPLKELFIPHAQASREGYVPVPRPYVTAPLFDCFLANIGQFGYIIQSEYTPHAYYYCTILFLVIDLAPHLHHGTIFPAGNSVL